MTSISRYDTILFDLDGTLLNTLPDLHASVNATLQHYGYPLQSMQAVRSFIGNGVDMLVARVEEPETTVPETTVPEPTVPPTTVPPTTVPPETTAPPTVPQETTAAETQPVQTEPVATDPVPQDTQPQSIDETTIPTEAETITE